LLFPRTLKKRLSFSCSAYPVNSNYFATIFQVWLSYSFCYAVKLSNAGTETSTPKKRVVQESPINLL
ncbi:hypothetical protein IKZ77_01660, partial [Candidatus Saccharibacteria bacterium]|nr:hypothetical protein [Candidatus Saccharibacteria bacterium]